MSAAAGPPGHSLYPLPRQFQREEAVLQYFTKKVERYKQQDRKARSKVNDDCFVTVARLIGCLGTSCSDCGDALVYESKYNRPANKIDHTVGHEIDNVVSYGCWCNCCLSNK